MNTQENLKIHLQKFFENEYKYKKCAINATNDILQNGITHKCNSSPGNWRCDATYYILIGNHIFVFFTEWNGNKNTIKNRFDNLKNYTKTREKLKYLISKATNYKHGYDIYTTNFFDKNSKFNNLNSDGKMIKYEMEHYFKV